MRKACDDILEKRGFDAKIIEVNDHTAVQPGAALAIWSSNGNCILGMDMAGRVGLQAEKIGSYVARNFIKDVSTNATVDRFLSDQIVIYAALARGVTTYKIPFETEHLRTNLSLVSNLLGIKASVKGNTVTVEGAGMPNTAL
jgi:RNA 3'-terminal phosphate cyclase (ATP)